MPTMLPMLTPEQVAQRLQVTKRTVYRWLGQGRLQGVKLGRLWRVRPEALEAFVGRHPAGGGPGSEPPDKAVSAGPGPSPPAEDRQAGHGAWGDATRPARRVAAPSPAMPSVAATEDLARRLEEAEPELPEEELADYLEAIRRRSGPKGGTDAPGAGPAGARR